ncbi:MAG: hypothetical protein IJJ28_05810, partial [Lentisphaeria bacterium]|nr:hypothetical protein [Lentisphaeria bacterium]
LPPELSLAVAFLHARRHRWNNRAALIADYAFLLAKHPGFDWARARDLAREFGTGDPGLLCFALPELFPREVLPPGPVPDAGVLRALRKVTLAEFDLKEHRESDVLSRADRFSRAWWRGRFAGFLPEVVRFRYRLPDDAGPGRMFRAYCRMCGDKAKLLWIGVFRRDRAVSGALRAAGEIERYLNERSDETSPERNG